MEPDPQHVDLLKETFGLSAKSRSVSTPADEKRDNYDDTPVEQQESTANRSATDELGIHRGCHHNVPIFRDPRLVQGPQGVLGCKGFGRAGGFRGLGRCWGLRFLWGRRREEGGGGGGREVFGDFGGFGMRGLRGEER